MCPGTDAHAARLRNPLLLKHQQTYMPCIVEVTRAERRQHDGILHQLALDLSLSCAAFLPVHFGLYHNAIVDLRQVVKAHAACTAATAPTLFQSNQPCRQPRMLAASQHAPRLRASQNTKQAQLHVLIAGSDRDHR